MADSTLCGESPETIAVGGEPLVTPHSFFLGDCLKWLPTAIVSGGSPQWSPPPLKSVHWVCLGQIKSHLHKIFNIRFLPYKIYLKKNSTENVIYNNVCLLISEYCFRLPWVEIKKTLLLLEQLHRRMLMRRTDRDWEMNEQELGMKPVRRKRKGFHGCIKAVFRCEMEQKN